MKRKLSLLLATIFVASACTEAFAAPAKTGKTIAGYGSANHQSLLDYKDDGTLVPATGSEYKEALPKLTQRDIDSNSSTGAGVTVPLVSKTESTPIEELVENPFSDLYFDDVFAGPSDEEFSWMVENNVISRDHNVKLGKNGVTDLEQIPVYDKNNLNTTAKKSEFLVGIYKALFGTIESRLILFQASSIRNAKKITYHWVEGDEEDDGYWAKSVGSSADQEASAIGKADVVTSDFVDYWEYEYTPYDGAGPTQAYINKTGDLLYYVNPNVYEVYLAAMLDKNLIKREEISDTQFLDEYDDIMKKSGSKPTLPEWYSQIGPVMATNGPKQQTIAYTPSASKNYLGRRYSLSGVGGSEVTVEFNDNVNYFMQETLSVMTALKYVEKFLRVTEEDLTAAEAETIAYKYGVSYLADYSEDERDTIMFLVAKGIINFENPDEYRNLYGSLTDDYMYTLIYRLARPEARKQFHEIQLTDADSFWLERGYQESRYVLKKENDTRKVRLVENGSYVAMPVPNVETISVQESGGTPSVRQSGNTTVYSNLFSDDDENMKTFTIVKEFDILEKYRFNGKPLKDAATNSDDPYIKVSPPDEQNNSVTFTVQAQTDVIAMAAVDSKIQVATDSVYEDYSLRTVTKISSDGEETTLVHQSIFQEADSEIILLEDKVLKNKLTGATAVLMPDQGIALVGSHVVVSDDIMVTAVNGEVYYNLDVIVTLMSNAYMSDINPFDIYQVKDLYTEQNIPIQSPSGNTIGNILALTLNNPLYTGGEVKVVSGLKKIPGLVLDLMSTVVTAASNLVGGSQVKTEDVNKLISALADAQHSIDGGGDSADVSAIPGFNFVNLSQTLEGSNHLIRDFEVSTHEGKTVKFKMILFFTYEVPDIEFDFENPDVFGDNPSLEDFNRMMTERPKDRALAEYWDNNLELSNAFANVIYDTKGVQYIKNGYLMPHVRILYQDKEHADDSVLYDLMVKVGSEFSQDFVNTYLGTDSYNSKVSDTNPSDTSGVYYPAKELTRNLLPLWVHAMFNNKQEILVGGTSSAVISNEPKAGRANTQLWRYMMAERSFNYIKPTYSAASLSVYVSGADVFLVTDSNIVYKLDSSQSKIMPGKIESNAFHMNSRTTKTLDGMKDLIGSVVTFDNGNGEVSSFYFEGISGNCLVLVDTAYVEGTPKLVAGKMSGSVEIDGLTVFPDGSKSSDSSTQFSDRYNSLSKMFSSVSRADSVPDKSLVDVPYGLPHESKIPAGVYAVGRPTKASAKDEPIFKRFNTNGSEGESLSMNALGGEKVRAHARLLVNSNHFKIDATGMIYYKASPSLYSAGNIYFSSLNKGLMDSIIAKNANVVSVNSLTDGQKLLFTDTVLLKHGDWFYSEPQYNVQSWEELVKSWNNPEEQKAAVLRYFAGTIISTSRVQVSLSAFIKDAGLGRIKPGIEPDRTLVGSPTSESEALVFMSDGTLEKYSGFSSSNLPKSVCFRLLLNDTLLCRLVDEDSQTYELLYATNALSEGYLDDIPFFNESLSIGAKDDLFYRLNLNDFKVSYMANDLKEQFLENYRRAQAGELKEMFQFLFAWATVAYTFFLWMAWAIVNIGLGKGLLLAVKYPTAGSRKGIDVVSLITFGTFDLESDVNGGRVLITTILLMALAVIVTMI